VHALRRECLQARCIPDVGAEQHERRLQRATCVAHVERGGGGGLRLKIPNRFEARKPGRLDLLHKRRGREEAAAARDSDGPRAGAIEQRQAGAELRAELTVEVGPRAARQREIRVDIVFHLGEHCGSAVGVVERRKGPRANAVELVRKAADP